MSADRRAKGLLQPQAAEWMDARIDIPVELDEGRSDDVLVHLTDGTQTVAWYDHDSALWITSFGEINIANAYGVTVTHWCELPAGPGA